MTQESIAFPGRRRSTNSAKAIADGTAPLSTKMDAEKKQYGAFVHETRPEEPEKPAVSDAPKRRTLSLPKGKRR